MNEHLQPVFGVLLPELEGEGIKYWVYGGVGIAAVAGEFFRRNTDVDIFVEERDFPRATSRLHAVCKGTDLRPKPCKPLKVRPKFEVIDNEGREILSVVPAYRKEGHVEFIFLRRPASYPKQMLQRTSRNVGGYHLFSPPNECIKELFKTYVTNRPDLITRPDTRANIRRDAEKILTPDEISQLGIRPATGATPKVGFRNTTGGG